MAHVSIADVQFYLDKNKLEIDENDQLEDETTYVDIVFSRVSNLYSVSGWTDATTTPSLIKRIIAMLIAASRYNKIYSEEDDAGNRYAGKLEARAYGLIDMIISGQASVLDSSMNPLAETADPKFWPNDVSNASEVMNALGQILAQAGEDDIKVRMSMRF
jgi:hypothetical protein